VASLDALSRANARLAFSMDTVTLGPQPDLLRHPAAAFLRKAKAVPALDRDGQ
jgi:hypothetical protein